MKPVRKIVVQVEETGQQKVKRFGLGGSESVRRMGKEMKMSLTHRFPTTLFSISGRPTIGMFTQ